MSFIDNVVHIVDLLQNKEFTDENGDSYIIRLNLNQYKTHINKFVDTWCDSGFYCLRVLAVHKRFLFNKKKLFHIKVSIEEVAEKGLKGHQISFVECKQGYIKCRLDDIGSNCLNEI